MQYLAIKDNKIIGYYDGGHPDFDEAEQVKILEAEEYNVEPGNDIRIYKDVQKGIKKTASELVSEELLTREEYNAEMDLKRQEAYRTDTDPLGMQVLRGELKKEEWFKKIEEIKERYPKL